MYHLSLSRLIHPFHTPVEFTKAESAALYISHTIRAMALALVGIFVPLFIYNLPGKHMFVSDQVVNNIVWIIGYYTVQEFSFLLMHLLTDRIIFRWLGFRYAIFLGDILLATWAIALYFTSSYLWLLVPAGILSGVSTQLYWIPYHIFFIRKAGEQAKHFGKETSFRYFLVRVISSISPIAGGFMIALFGFKPLFITAMLLMIASSLPVLMEVHENKHNDHKAKTVLTKFLFNKSLWGQTVSFFGQGVQDYLFAAIWPVVMFLVLEDFEKIGILSGITIFLSSVGILFVGRLVDRFGNRRIHLIGSVVESGYQLARMFVTTAVGIYGIDISERILGGLYALPIMSETYELARGHDETNFILYREYALHLGYLSMGGIALLFILLVKQWQLIFAFGIIGSALSYLIYRR